MILNRHVGSRYAPQRSIDHRVSILKDMVEEERSPPSRSTHLLDPHEINRAIVELREDLDHLGDRRYALIYSVRLIRKNCEADRAKHRANYATPQPQSERDVRSLVDELAAACREILQLSSEISLIRDYTDRL